VEPAADTEGGEGDEAAAADGGDWGDSWWRW
jgi:hypothetical protein